MDCIWVFATGGSRRLSQASEMESVSSISEDSGLSAELWETVGPSCLAHA